MRPAGPRLGNGPRWDLSRAVVPKKRAKKEAVERQLKWLADIAEEYDWDAGKGESDLEWDYFEEDEEDVELEEMFQNRFHEADDQADLTRLYIEDIERENQSLHAGPGARCQKMLQRVLSGSGPRDADVQFEIDGGVGCIWAHRDMLSAASEVFAGMFESEWKDARAQKIPAPPGISLSGMRGLLEWVYIGERSARQPRHRPVPACLSRALDISQLEPLLRPLAPHWLNACTEAFRSHLGSAHLQVVRERNARRQTGASCGFFRRCLMWQE